ncbi:hypothetical protein Tco_0579174 [Tanacetum coccineum]
MRPRSWRGNKPRLFSSSWTHCVPSYKQLEVFFRIGREVAATRAAVTTVDAFGFAAGVVSIKTYYPEGRVSLARITEAHFEVIAHKEKATIEKAQTIKETADTITSLRSEVASLEVKGSLDANEEIKKAHTRVHELEKQVEKLPIELQLKNNFMEALETRSHDLEKKMLYLNPTLHDLQKFAVDQKKKR